MPSSGTKPLTRVLARSVPGGSRVKGRAYQLDGAVTEDRRHGVGRRRHRQGVACLRGRHPSRRARPLDRVVRLPLLPRTASSSASTSGRRFSKPSAAATSSATATLPETATIEPVDRGDASDPEYATRAETARRAGREKARRPRPWEQFLEEFSRNLTEAESLPAAPRFADAQIVYVIDRAATIAGETLALDLQSRQRKKNGEWGRPKPAPVGSADLGHLPDALDRRSCRCCSARPIRRPPAMSTEPVRARVVPSRGAAASIACCRWSRSPAARSCACSRQPGEQLVQLAWDDGPPWTFRLEIVHASRRRGLLDRRRPRPRQRTAGGARAVAGAGERLHLPRQPRSRGSIRAAPSPGCRSCAARARW